MQTFFIVASLWVLVGLATALVADRCGTGVERKYDRVTRRDAILFSVYGPLALVVLLQDYLEYSDFWHEPLFKDKDDV